MRSGVSMLAAGLLLGTMASPAAAQSAPFRVGSLEVMRPAPSLFSIGVGAFDVAREGDESDRDGYSAVGRIEYRLGGLHLPISPTIGVFANHHGGVFGYGGFSFDLALGQWRLSPLLTAGAYRQGYSKSLGGMFEFQAGGTVAYELANGARVGIAVTHVSNAFTHRTNPGAELIFLSYAIPFWPTL